MAIIWTFVPRDFEMEKLGRVLPYMIRWVTVENTISGVFVDGEKPELKYENPEKFTGVLYDNKTWYDMETVYARIAIFDSEEQKVKFILQWL